MKFNPRRTALLLLFAASALPLAPGARAETPIFVYTNRDLIVSFRQTGSLGGPVGPNDLEVDIGQASIYSKAAAGSTTTIAQVIPAQLNGIFTSLDYLSWSVGGCVPTVGDTGDPSIPTRTLWVTAPRPNSAAQAAPWLRNGPTTQGATAAEITSILENASFYSGTASGSSNNTASVVLIPVGTGHEFGAFMGDNGNYNGTFQGDVENTTPGDFTTAQNTSDSVSRSDLYELEPDATGTQPAGVYLGYFELRPSGTLVFVAAGGTTAPPAPELTITRDNNVSTISFTSAMGATYTLQYKNAAGLLAPGGWTSATPTLTGNGSSISFQDTSTDPNRFYRVGAQ